MNKNIIPDEPVYSLLLGPFKGINQSVGEEFIDYSQSPDTCNFVSEDGELRVRNGTMAYATIDHPDVSDFLINIIPINTEGTGATGEQLFIIQDNAGTLFLVSRDETLGIQFTKLAYTLENTAFGLHYVNYKIDNTDVCIFSDGGYTNAPLQWDGTTLSILTDVPADIGMRGLALSEERIWALGVYSMPNMIYFSDDYDPKNWNASYSEGGAISLETWDNTHCNVIVCAFDDVFIFKENSIWRITGSDPSDFAINQIFAPEGTKFFKGVVFAGDMIFYMGKRGIYALDGNMSQKISSRINGYIHDANHGDFKAFQYNTIVNAVSDLNKLYFMCRVDTDVFHTYVYDKEKNHFDVWSGIIGDKVCHRFSDYNRIDNQEVDIYFISATKDIFVLGGDDDNGDNIDAYWYTPWMDMGLPGSTKIVSEIYITALQLTDGDIKITLYSGSSDKNYSIATESGINTYKKKIKIKGDKIKLKIENVSGSRFSIKKIEIKYKIIR